MIPVKSQPAAFGKGSHVQHFALETPVHDSKCAKGGNVIPTMCPDKHGGGWSSRSFGSERRHDQPSALFWKLIIALAMTAFAGNVIGMAEFGGSWFTAYWDTLAYYCSGGYCR